MKNLDLIAEELFNKIRGRFPSVTIGDSEGKVTNKPNESRFYDFDYVEGDRKLGKVSISLNDDAVEVMYSSDFVANEDVITRENWYDFLKELRQFSKKRMLSFDTRNINKSNLDQRDYKFLATNRSGDQNMNESKMYGTNKTSYQRIGEARIAIKHTKPVDTESATGRIQNIGAIFIESPEGERFKYPFKHLNGARAMARHVAEGGKPFDDFGTHITGLSEELSSLKKFKSYVGRSSVMAEGLSGYLLPVNERLEEIKKTISNLQKESSYKVAFENFEKPVFEEVPNDVAENWVDQLTIKQFNEELKDVFPFVYRLVSEATRAKIVSASDLLGEKDDGVYRAGMEIPQDVDGGILNDDPVHVVRSGDTVYSLAKLYGVEVDDVIEVNGLDDKATIRPGDQLIMPGGSEQIGASPFTPGATRGIDPSQNYSPDDLRRLTTGEALEDAFEEMMGQFGERVVPGQDPNVNRLTGKPNAPDFGQQARDQMALNQKVQANADAAAGNTNDLGDGFQAVDADVAGQKVKGVLDTQSGSTIVLNKSIVRSPGKYLVIDKSGKIQSTMQVGPMTKKALQAAGLDEGNKFTAALAKAKANDDDEMEVDGKKIPVTEFILSLYDRETGQFPKGETAVLTAVEKDYGEQYINPAKAFIEAINAKFEEFHGYKDSELMDGADDDDYYGPNYKDELDDIILKITPSSKSPYRSKRKVDTKAPVIDPEDMFDEGAIKKESEKTDIGNYFTKSNPEVLKKQKLFLAMTNELASREDLPKEEFIGGVQQFIKPSHDDGDFLKFAKRALVRMITVMREKNDPRWREWFPIVTEYIDRVLDRAIKRAYNPDQNDPRTMGRSQDDEVEESGEDLNQQILGFARYLMQQDRELGYRASDLMQQHPGQPKMALQALQSDPEINKMWQAYSSMNTMTSQPQGMNTMTSQSGGLRQVSDDIAEVDNQPQGLNPKQEVARLLDLINNSHGSAKRKADEIIDFFNRAGGYPNINKEEGILAGLREIVDRFGLEESQEELGRIKDKYKKESQDIMRLAGL